MRNRRQRRGFSLLLVAGLAACGSLDTFTVRESATAEVPARTIVDQLLETGLGFAGFDSFSFAQTQEFRNRDVKPEMIRSVRIRSLALAISEPTDGDFDFLDGIRFQIEADGHPRIEIARLDNVPRGVRDLDLQVSAGAELRPYATAKTARITTSVEGRRPEQRTWIDANVRFEVEIELRGLFR